MKVCLDVQSAVSQSAGVGRYTRNLVHHLAATAEADELVLAYFAFRGRRLDFRTDQATARAIRWCPGRLAQKAWKTLHWPPFDWLAGKADVYHFPNFILPPLREGKAVVSIHDVSFLRFPELAEARNLNYLRSRIQDTVRRADAIITISRFSAAEIQELLHVGTDRLFPIYLGIADAFRAPDPGAIRTTLKALGLDRPYLLMVSTIEPRKNIPFLVTTFEALHDFDGDLVLAGGQGWKTEPIMASLRDSPRARHIRYLNRVDDAQLPALYAGAQAFVFPSLYEGFGFPPLEAMACGTPVVSSTAGSLAEVLGTAAVTLDTFDADLWADRIRSLLTDSAFREQRIAEGHRCAAQYTWTQTARQTWAVYRQVNP